MYHPPSSPHITIPKLELGTPILSALPEVPLDPDYNNEEHLQPRQATNHHKLLFLEYNGNREPSQWLYKCNKFFVTQNTKEEE